MLFNSIEFIIFFAIVLLLYFIIPHRFRWIFLLLASYYFYMAWNPTYVILLIISTLINYVAGIMMGRTDEKVRRRKYLILSLLVSLGLLFTFKYFDFFNDSLRTILSYINISYNIPDFNLLLPIGISFYTFQSLSYSIDVYRGKRKPEKHFGIFALYVSFFPQLVAGPIERSTRLLPQFRQKQEFNYARVANGIKLMVWGFFKKIVIADTLAVFVNNVYNNPTQFQGLLLIIATVFFAFQIFCDFSGYSDIAIGAAQVMGYKLMLNFRRPYYAQSVSEFWERWHISLSTWFRDYFYITIGGNRVKIPRYYFNIFVTFLISGLWHGSNWTFVIWGALHGIYVIIERLTEKFRKRIASAIKLDRNVLLYKIIQIFITFCLVSFAWIFFRSNSISDSVYIVKNLFTGFSNLTSLDALKSSLTSMGLDEYSVIKISLSILIMEIVHLIQRKTSVIKMFSTKPLIIRWVAYFSLILYILFFRETQVQEFIYFQF